MKFINKGKEVKIRFKEEGGYRWQTVRTEQIVDIPEEIGLKHKFEKVKEKLEKTKKESKSKK